MHTHNCPLTYPELFFFHSFVVLLFCISAEDCTWQVQNRSANRVICCANGERNKKEQKKIISKEKRKKNQIALGKYTQSAESRARASEREQDNQLKFRVKQ